MTLIIKQKIRTIPHWPKPGVMFRDITTLLKDAGDLSGPSICSPSVIRTRG